MSKVLLGKLNVLAIYITWIFLFSLIVGLVGIMLKIESLAILTLVGFVGLLVFGLIHFVLSFFVRCPSCKKMLTSQGLEKPEYEGSTKINGWSYVAIKWFSGSVSCIHCGHRVNTNAL